MCGIVGIASKYGNLKDFPIQNLTDTLSHRGPDDSGYYTDDHVARIKEIQKLSERGVPLAFMMLLEK